ncbi:MAG: proton-conducting transporter membrane subunit, partial [Elusimicrobiota bacterium]
SPWQPWWGWLLITIGAVSGLLGVIFALAQHDFKRLLAYHSIENIGIITLGLGLGVLGTTQGIYPLAALGFAGALLHVVNHALFKGLLFMGAGAVLHATGTAELETLGGLSKRMPRTAICFLIGAVAIAGLPPLNGFISEFFIYFGAFTALRAPLQAATGAVLTIAVMAAIGTLASACFAKAFGAVFLGEPRSAKCAATHEAGPLMVFAMGMLAAACVLIGFISPLLVAPLASAIACGFDPRLGLEFSAAAGIPLLYISAGALTLAAALALITVFRRFLLRGRHPAAGPTWDCGYAAPSVRTQYGASSFAQPLTDFFQPILRTDRHYSGLKGFFPAGADFHTEANPVFYNHLYTPAANFIKRLAFRYSWLQHGRLQLYILYIVAALIVLLVWKL